MNSADFSAKILIAREFISRKVCFLAAFVFIIGSTGRVNAQTYDYGFSPEQNVVVRNENGRTMHFPWTGGLNFAQFSETDLNFDGIPDLFVFDKTGNRILTFIHTGSDADSGYVYAPEYALCFPDLHDWVLMRDFNCDGFDDIFTYNTGGCSVYRSTAVANDTLGFELETNVLYSDYGGSFPINLYITSADIPSITDMDGDGDLDILTFHILGSFLQLHRNLSVEMTGACDTLYYVLDENCWGHFKENELSNAVELNMPCPWSKYADDGEERHTGSTVLNLDLDGDGDMDMLLGDTDFKNLIALFNEPDSTGAVIHDQDTMFPSYDVHVEMDLMPASFLVDADHDGLKDLLVAPFDTRRSDNKHGVWYYKNTGSASIPHFSYQQSDFIQSDMLDFGEGCYPALMDFDGDGLTDILTGNYGYLDHTFDSNGFVYAVFRSSLALMRNTGTILEPEFRVASTDLFNLSDNDCLALAPTPGDLDGDGDTDILIGNSDGTLIFVENTAGQGNSPVFAPPSTHFAGIDIGAYSTPCIYDINGDGLTDILCGEKSGKLFLFLDHGTMGNPVFYSSPDYAEFGGVNVTNTQVTNYGYSTPAVFRMNTILSLFVGSYSGEIHYFRINSSDLSAQLTAENSLFLPGGNRYKSSLVLGNLDDKSFPELIVGNYAGGLEFFRGRQPSGTGVKEENEACRFSVSVNDGFLELMPDGTCNEIIISTEIFDNTGRRMILNSGSDNRVDVSSLRAGLYFFSVKTSTGIFSGKFISF
ncbi:MAG: T9SS type A sorting domain-containing protein [Bacteroidetes bacterium]|nr:T9SS type A sorting domain-containing protein [Bacteroidota bacterium]